MLCSYRPILITTSYAVLARAGYRCGSERLIKSVRAGWGQTVHVPKPGRDELVLVKITGVQVGIAESIEGFLSQSAQRSISLSGATAQYRLVPGTAADGLPLSTSTALDYPVPFNTTLSVGALAIGKAGVRPTAGEPASLTYAFYSLQIKPWSAAPK
jgi:hypothetical protein